MKTIECVLMSILLLGPAACGPSAPASEGVLTSEDTGETDMRGMDKGSTDTGDMEMSGDRQPVMLTAAQERAVGVVYATVGRMDLDRSIRTVGRVEVAESSVTEITPKVAGFVEEVFVNTTGESVTRGQSLLTLYSPQLVAAQEELLTAQRLLSRIDAGAEEAVRSAVALLAAAERRLAYWDITDEQIDRLKRTGEVMKSLALVSPVDGIVLEKGVNVGQRVSPGALLYRLADLSEIWIEGAVFEQDLQFVHLGSQAHIDVPAYPGEHRMGRVSFVYPTIDVDSRTNRVRVTLDNSSRQLKPGMFVTMYFEVSIGTDVIAVPRSAVIVTGERNLVFVRGDDAMLTPRDVVVGAHAADYWEILSGLEEGEVIVTSAGFLVDAESRLGSTGMAGMPGMNMSAPGGENR